MKPSQRAIVLLQFALDVVADERRFRDPKDTTAEIALKTSERLIHETVQLLQLVDEPR